MFSEHLDEKLKFGGENPINKLPSRIIDTPEKKKEFVDKFLDGIDYIDDN